jgi:hypothetical protein
MLGSMPRVHRLSNSSVYVHARNEHPPPHFHAIGPDWEVVIHIESRTIRKGWAPRADLSEVLIWAEANETYLLQKWDEFNERDN